MPEIVYKVCPAADWFEANGKGYFYGSPDDVRDGYIHLSTVQQLAGTLRRHFSNADGIGLPDLVLVALPVEQLGESLKWEPARGGQLFPHLYGALETRLASAVVPLEVASDGVHILPGDIERC